MTAGPRGLLGETLGSVVRPRCQVALKLVVVLPRMGCARGVLLALGPVGILVGGGPREAGALRFVGAEAAAEKGLAAACGAGGEGLIWRAEPTSALGPVGGCCNCLNPAGGVLTVDTNSTARGGGPEGPCNGALGLLGV